MTLIDKLASSLNRRDEAPNRELAKAIADSNDKVAVKELFDNLISKSKDIQSDCIKVIYETGERKPSLVAPYAKELIALLDHKNNRLQWGAMTALNTITLEKPVMIYDALSKIIAAMNSGSVITKDHGINILIKLCSLKQYADSAFSLLNGQLLDSPVNQLPMYAEKAMPVINEKNAKLFMKTLSLRLKDIEKDSKRKRVEMVIRKISK